MFIINCRNVCEAFPKVIEYLTKFGRKENSRNGPVLVAPTPVMTVYEHPEEKILFSPLRDANPIFHLLESCWMLHGDNDAEFLNHYIRNFGDRYGNDGKLHGAYGQRWRYHFGVDQLQVVIDKLKKNPLDRQTVISMWDATSFIHEGADDLLADVNDRPCNLTVLPRVNNGRLDITTIARSHDAIFGSTGANAVHFSILQEYLASMIGVPVGKFYQFSNNLHAYTEVLNKLLAKSKTSENYIALGMNVLYDNPYPMYVDKLVDYPDTFDVELNHLMKTVRLLHQGQVLQPPTDGANKFLWDVVYQVARTHAIFKSEGAHEALIYSNNIGSEGWKKACVQWLERRMK